MKNKISFLLFENFHQKKNIGSSRIRGHWLINNMEGAELFCQGKDYEVIYYQKVYWKEHARTFKGIKILDICDPDWLDGAEIVELLGLMDAITVSTKKLKGMLDKMTDTPVFVIPDRIDFNTLPNPKVHKKNTKKVAWFGYSHNMNVLDPALNKLKKEGLTLKVISNGNFNTSECSVENVKWEAETADKEIQECDFVLLPDFKIGKSIYKSNNKTVHSWALGMPVAKTPEELERFKDPKEREKEAEKRLKEVYQNYDIEQSVEELEEIISVIKEEK